MEQQALFIEDKIELSNLQEEKKQYYYCAIVEIEFFNFIILQLAIAKGPTGSLLKIISFVLALVSFLYFFKPVSTFIIDKTDWDENLEQGIRDTILSSDKQEELISQEENKNILQKL